MTEPATRQPIWKNLGARFVSAVVMAGVLFIPFYFGGYFWAVTMGLLGARAAWEWVDMTDVATKPLAYGIPVVGLIVAIIAHFTENGHWLYGIIFVTAVIAFLERLTRKEGEKIWAPFGVAYIVLPCVVAIMLRGSGVGWDDQGFKLLTYLFLVVIAADVGAYFGGSYFKGPKLVPKLSPKKTWSGLLSGIFLGVILGALFGYFLKMGPVKAGVVAVPIVLISVLGDFFESGIKRRMNVKDAGDILPGHGGILDRLDSILMVMIFAHFLTYVFNLFELI